MFSTVHNREIVLLLRVTRVDVLCFKHHTVEIVLISREVGENVVHSIQNRVITLCMEFARAMVPSYTQQKDCPHLEGDKS